MKAIVTIDLSTPQAQSLLSYLSTLPFAEVKQTKSKSKKSTFEAAAAACNAITLDDFVSEGKRQIKEHFKNA